MVAPILPLIRSFNFLHQRSSRSSTQEMKLSILISVRILGVANKASIHNPELFINCNSFHFLNVQSIVNQEKQFSMINIMFAGSTPWLSWGSSYCWDFLSGRIHPGYIWYPWWCHQSRLESQRYQYHCENLIGLLKMRFHCCLLKCVFSRCRDVTVVWCRLQPVPVSEEDRKGEHES